MEIAERFINYTKFDTQSVDESETVPSNPKQLIFARYLKEELEKEGLKEVEMDEKGYIYATLPANTDKPVPTIGFIAHYDTALDASGANIKARIVKGYDGGDIELSPGIVSSPKMFPELLAHKGEDLIVTDGTTLLGADDKAGIAEIMTAAETILTRNLPHGTICIGFTPDEEIGEGTLCFDVEEFGAAYAFTLDGGAAGEIEYRNFNAAEAEVKFRGVNVHPGSAKGIMINAQKLAFTFDAQLPPGETPEKTEGLEGFYHLARTAGTVGEAQLTYLLRDHDGERFAARKAKLQEIADRMNRQYGAGTVNLSCRDQYRNMAEVIDRHPHLLELARRAVREAGLLVAEPPIRGGTDGALLSFRNLPCPNLGTGGYNFHGEQEFASVQEMEAQVRVILNLVDGFRREPPRPQPF